MYITSFYSSDDVKDYTLQKLNQNFIKINLNISGYIQYSGLSTDTVSVLSDYISDNQFDYDSFNTYLLDKDHINHYIQNHCTDNFDSFSYKYFFIGTKEYLKKNVFNDIVPSIQEVYLNNFMYSLRKVSGLNFVPDLHSFYQDTYTDLSNEIDYSDYFTQAKKIINKLQADNKFYNKQLSDIQLEIIELRRQNADLQQKLNLKSISSWG